MSSATAPTPLLQARGLKVGYGGVEVVRSVDLEVNPAEVVALLGPNGAGKTTTLLALSGDLKPLRGEVLMDGRVVTAPLHVRARNGLGLVTEQRSIFMKLTTAENLRVSRGDVDFALELFPELKSRLDVAAGMLSGGEQQMLALARALCRRPRLLLADELSLGLAPIVVDRLLEVVRSAAREGVGVLLVEQQVRKVMRFVDRVYVMRLGEIELHGSADEISKRMAEVEGVYLS